MGKWFEKLKISIAVAKMVAGGKPDSKAGKILEKLDKGSDVAGKVLEGLELAKVLIKK